MVKLQDLIKEEETFKLKKKDGGNIVVFKNKDNYEKALKVLRSRIYEMELQKKMEEESSQRKTMVSSGDRSEKIRTYNYPQGIVTDHRIGLTKYNLQSVVSGDLQEFVDELIIAENTQKLKIGKLTDE